MSSSHAGASLSILTPDEAWEQAYKESVTTDIQHQAQWLLETVGPRFATAGVGIRDARTFKRWAEGLTEPRDHVEDARLRLLFRISYAITRTYGRPSVATSFLRSANPQLEDEAPLLVLRQSDPDDAQQRLLAATRAFLEG